ncbi:hypothetical protein E4U61_005739 [Claviceps capensis]|nr:hypothetical protein E4U61_005739 [Claviceps capensis]
MAWPWRDKLRRTSTALSISELSCLALAEFQRSLTNRYHPNFAHDALTRDDKSLTVGARYAPIEPVPHFDKTTAKKNARALSEIWGREGLGPIDWKVLARRISFSGTQPSSPSTQLTVEMGNGLNRSIAGANKSIEMR